MRCSDEFNSLHCTRRQPDMLARPPGPRGNDEVADVPIDVVGEEILYVAKVAVRCVDVIVVDRGDASEMRIAFGAMALRVCRLTRCGLRKDQRFQERRGDVARAEIRRPPRWIPPIVVVQIVLLSASSLARSSRASGLASICCLVSLTTQQAHRPCSSSVARASLEG